MVMCHTSVPLQNAQSRDVRNEGTGWLLKVWREAGARGRTDPASPCTGDEDVRELDTRPLEGAE